MTGVAGARRVVLAIGASVLLGGCVTRAPLTDAYDGPEALPEPLAAPYEVELEPVPVQVTDVVRERRDFVVREILLPGSDGADGTPPVDELRFEYYDVDGDDVTPAIVVLPIANGNMLVSRYFARYFASRGWASLVIDHARDPMDDVLEDPESLIRRNIIDYRRVLDWVDRQPEIDSIGVFGLSFGGMAAVMLAALDDRVDAIVAAMAGGDLPYLLVNTSYRAVARQVHRSLRETGLSRERLKERLDELIRSDPLVFAPYVDAEDVLLVMTRTDMIVPFETQQRLRDELGEPETLFLPTGHRTSVFYFPLLRSSAYDFFERQFSASR
ncbi:MAG TPA: CocE/NonD family hydrolase [Gammaproteobacteria bacterium]